MPQLADVPGVVSCTLVDLGDDVVTSLGVFISEASAVQANALAQAWAKSRLADLGAAPPEAQEGEVLMHSVFRPDPGKYEALSGQASWLVRSERETPSPVISYSLGRTSGLALPDGQRVVGLRA
ncbi:MAG TPA: hypothetical protein VGG35_15970 [Streptosporangiaceae bacterium]|jgi:hypothetical protein